MKPLVGGIFLALLSSCLAGKRFHHPTSHNRHDDAKADYRYRNADKYGRAGTNVVFVISKPYERMGVIKEKHVIFDKNLADIPIIISRSEGHDAKTALRNGLESVLSSLLKENVDRVTNAQGNTKAFYNVHGNGNFVFKTPDTHYTATTSVNTANVMRQLFNELLANLYQNGANHPFGPQTYAAMPPRNENQLNTHFPNYNGYQGYYKEQESMYNPNFNNEFNNDKGRRNPNDYNYNYLDQNEYYNEKPRLYVAKNFNGAMVFRHPKTHFVDLTRLGEPVRGHHQKLHITYIPEKNNHMQRNLAPIRGKFT